MSQRFNESTQFVDEATGELLVGGFLYIGENGLDAKLNPLTIYPDRELSGTPLANPQTIGSDGRSLNKIWVSGKYSFLVESSANVQKYNELENGFDEQVGNTLLINSLGINDVVANGSPTVSALVDSQTYVFTAPSDNTGAMTLKIDNTTALSLKIRHDQALASGDIKKDQKIVVVANLTDNIFEVQTDLSGVTLNGIEELNNKTLPAPAISDATFSGTQTGFAGNVTGNVTGDLAGDVTADTVDVDIVTAKTTDGDLELTRNGTGDVIIDSTPIYGMVILDTPILLVTDTSSTSTAKASVDITAHTSGVAVKAIVKSQMFVRAGVATVSSMDIRIGEPSETFSTLHSALKVETEVSNQRHSGDSEIIVNLDSGENFAWELLEVGSISICTATLHLVGYYV